MPQLFKSNFYKALESSLSFTNSHQKLKQPFCKTSTVQNALSFIGPVLWNKTPKGIKRTTNRNTLILLKRNYQVNF